MHPLPLLPPVVGVDEPLPVFALPHAAKKQRKKKDH